jgi:hypothetical protein
MVLALTAGSSPGEVRFWGIYISRLKKIEDRIFKVQIQVH